MPSRTPLPLILALLLGACSRGFASRDPVILSLGDQVVRRSDFERHVKDLEARGGAPLTREVRSALLEPYLEEQVLVLEARARGLLSGTGSAEEQQAAVSRLLADGAGAAPGVSDDEIGAYYREHADEFRRPERVTLRQIVVGTINEARDVRRRVEKDPKEFDLVARSRSRAPDAAQGGMMGSFARGELPPDLERAAFALEPGALSEVVESQFGFHVLRVEAKEPARDVPLEECAGEIRTLLQHQKADLRVRQFVRDLMARAKVNHEAANPPRSDS